MSIFLEINKPTLLLDKSTAKANILFMAEKARKQGIRFRPHFKTHQSNSIGNWFRDFDVSAITVSSLEMAEYFASGGWNDITIAFPVNLRQADDIDRLSKEVKLGLLVESVESIRELAGRLTNPVDIWIKVDTGNRRTGLDWEDSQNALNLAADIKKFPVYNFKGILTHAGQTYQQRGSEAICQEYSKSNQHMLALKQEFERAGFSGLEISVGDTPGCKVCPELGPVDEIRPGNFIFFDSAQLQIGSCQWQDIAVALACPVVALHPERSEAVVYGGAIHLSKDFLEVGELRSYGLVCLPQGKRWGAPIKGAYVRGLSQEHGMLKLPQDTLRKLKIGNLICILPVHSCLTVQVMGCYTTLDGKTIETIPR